MGTEVGVVWVAAIADRRLTSLHHSFTSFLTAFVTYSLLPSGDPKWLLPSSVILIPVFLKSSIAWLRCSSLVTSQALAGFG